MDILSYGEPAAFADLKPGECFVFPFAESVVLGLKVQASGGRPATLILARPAGHAVDGPYLLSPSTTQPATVFKLSTARLSPTEVIPAQMRNGVRNPQRGHLVITPDDRLIGAKDTQGDVALVSLKTGEVGYELQGPAIVFTSWTATLKLADGNEHTLFAFTPAAAVQAA